MNERAIPEGEFDYVIVGAGTAGYVLANRMSQERDVSVASCGSASFDARHSIKLHR
jgi:choline dehydrogenase